MRVDFLKGLLVLEVVLLVMMFMLGEFVSFFEIPVKTSLGVFSYTETGLEVHHFIALFSVVVALLAILFSFKTRNILPLALSAVGLVLLGGASVGGIAFVFLQESKLYSLVMAACFIAAIIAYMSAIFSVKK